ncbi:hypothetical protein LCGC14_0538520 [marine sediment metagenome]|uniref:Uncharacterized protein n=1 Tax=marine sediment metagenome TaxID=412755 RepID=A0A0F9SBX4_9ZZZZ
MSTKAQIINKAMIDLGEKILTDADVASPSTNPAKVAIASWDIILPEMLNTGPEEGWKFAVRKFHGIDRDSITIASIAQNGTDITITGTHTLLAGDMVLLEDTSYDDTYDVKAISTTVSFDVTATFVATGTGTAKWTSEEFAYRFARPTSTRVVKVSVGGIEITDWKRQGEYILTNQEDTEVDMDYILHADDVTIGNFPPHFVDVMWRRLSAALAFDLVQNRELSDSKLNVLERIYIPRAIGMDNRETYEKEFDNSWQEFGH